MTAPCLNCKDRKSECHSTCAAYKNFALKNKAEREERHRKKQSGIDARNMKKDGVNKDMRRRRWYG